MRWRGAASSTTCAATRSTATIASRTRRRASSTRSPTGEIDVAVVWGPLAGYFATRQPVPLRVDAGAAAVRRAAASDGRSTSPWACARRTRRCAQEIDAALDRRRAEVDAILAAYGVPRLDRPARRRRRADEARAPRPASPCCWRSPACEREEREFRSDPIATETRRRRSRSCRSRPARSGPSSSDRGKGKDYEDNAYHLAQGKTLYAWFNCNGCHANGGGGSGPAADGRPLDLRRLDREHRADHPRGPAERHAVVPRQGARRPDLAARRLCALDERQRPEGRRARAATTTCIRARPRTARPRACRSAAAPSRPPPKMPQ